MSARWTIAAFAVALAVVACGSAEDEPNPDDTWVGTITTEGNVTNVVNESGSLWVGEARLVEEASIGEEGAGPEYLLGRVRDLATDGQRIFVADSQGLVVRVYDLDGTHLMDVGAPGQGPGEFQEAKGVGVGPDGRIFVQDDRARKIHVFDDEGEYLETWDRQWRSAFFDGRFTVGPDGPFIYMTLNPEAPPDERVAGMALVGPEGRTETVVEVPRLESASDSYVRYEVDGGGSGVAPVPFVPQPYWAMGADRTLVSGVADSYEFTIRHPDGSSTVVRRQVDPVPVAPGEFAWARDDIVARFRERDPTWTWNGPDAPPTKPFFERLFIGSGGRVWVLREMEGQPVQDCARGSEDPVERIERPCWQRPRVFEIFEADGRFLTTVEAPSRLRPDAWPVIDGSMLLVAEEDDVGNVVVKRYRLAQPGEEE